MLQDLGEIGAGPKKKKKKAPPKKAKRKAPPTAAAARAADPDRRVVRLPGVIRLSAKVPQKKPPAGTVRVVSASTATEIAPAGESTREQLERLLRKYGWILLVIGGVAAWYYMGRGRRRGKARAAA